jgi:hypothetical protein
MRKIPDAARKIPGIGLAMVLIRLNPAQQTLSR